MITENTTPGAETRNAAGWIKELQQQQRKALRDELRTRYAVAIVQGPGVSRGSGVDEYVVSMTEQYEAHVILGIAEELADADLAAREVE